jgi:hypothetical protein
MIFAYFSTLFTYISILSACFSILFACFQCFFRMFQRFSRFLIVDYLAEILGFKACAADQTAVDIGFFHQFREIFRVS